VIDGLPCRLANGLRTRDQSVTPADSKIVIHKHVTQKRSEIKRGMCSENTYSVKNVTALSFKYIIVKRRLSPGMLRHVVWYRPMFQKSLLPK
jgi:hypothetical protein